MTLQRATVADAAVGVAVADRADALRHFLMPGYAAAIWRKQTPPDMQSWLDTLSPSHFPQARVILRPDQTKDAVEQLCNIAETPLGAERDHLIDDIAALADVFSNLMGVDYLRLRLQAVTNDACRKFHIDRLTARLVCTYRGPGTQYGLSTDGTEPRRVFTVPTGAPILLRGTLWPEEPKSGLLHRSPPIEGTGMTRFVLVLDPVESPEYEA
ncbi:DUF1826 domain-containing protein [Thalassococcus sp. S3]|uniref:DUF1826 domain-containing protein n=1 Tax=Thalassococcus sp. S3 TaxID=2017482 RepID=UPI0010244C1B|nr:DUF1826 domain-containing protein [Thalassococcus sp. S3]QBF30094.1 hypothetical protein CFI11_02525 [Thalassococcus sp. S3]